MFQLRIDDLQEECILPNFETDIKMEVDETLKNNPICDCSVAITTAATPDVEEIPQKNMINEQFFIYDSETDSSSEILETRITWSSLTWKLNGELTDHTTFFLQLHQQQNGFEPLFRCYQKCKFDIFRDYNTFVNHMRFTHYEDLKFCCDVCNEYFKDRQEIAAHRYNHNIAKRNFFPKSFMCRECSRSYSDIDQLKNHLKFTHLYKCAFCTEYFIGKTACEKHEQAKHVLKGVPPALRVKRFYFPQPIAYLIDKTMEQLIKVKPTVEMCTDGDDVLYDDSAGGLDLSQCILQKTETENDPFLFRTNEETANFEKLTEKNSVEVTKKLSAGEKPGEIIVLKTKQMNKNMLEEKQNNVQKTVMKTKKHRKTKGKNNSTNTPKSHSTNTPKRHSTEANREIVKTRNPLKKNLHKMKAKPKLQCPKCSRSDDNVENFQLHLMTHVGSKLYNCKMCSKQFSLFYDLKSHMDSHSQEFPFTCTKCFQRFRLKATLMVHMERHTQPFICKICSKGFKRTTGLTDHMFSHL